MAASPDVTHLPVVAVVGVGAGGWAGLSDEARAELRAADVLVGSARQLALVTECGAPRTVPLPSPLRPALDELMHSLAGCRVVVLASGDPMWFGIGSTLLRLLGRDRVRVIPHPSSISLAAARLGWPIEDLDVVSVVGRPLELLHPVVQPGRRILVLTATGSGARDIRDLLDVRGYGPSDLTVLEQLGGPAERIVRGAGDADHDPLAIVAVHCRVAGPIAPLSRLAVLPDGAYLTDGQLTKREIRALVLSALEPVPGQTLWDVGAGSGSVGIEWMRRHPSSRAIAIEPRADRRERIVANAQRLGTPGLQVVAAAAPQALDGLPTPDAVFVGGGLSVAGVLDRCAEALAPGGRLVANAVTLESEHVLVDWYQRIGGTLTRLQVERAAPVGGFTGWRPALPVVQWAWRKGTGNDEREDER